ncbi:potassiumion transporter [Rhodotorula toruloides]|uniref:Potassium transport protein n=1 Tax=Rhodotorula toruloides TaxID=5286 RepID=A0A511K805_RHOTO|nr:potassiumion transporter [Rhodotorula toruloides]
MRRRLSLDRHPSTAPRFPKFLEQSSVWNRISAFSANHLNFYRLHLLAFTFLPLIASGIFFASNGPSQANQIPYIDALFMCTSAMTLTGLNTVLFVNLTVWQQFILFFLMSIGSTSFVSMLTIVIRRHFFRNKFAYMRRRACESTRLERKRLPGTDARIALSTMPTDQADPGTLASSRSDEVRWTAKDRERSRRRTEKLRTDMIKRVDTPVRINEMSVSGWLGGEKSGDEKEGKEGRGGSNGDGGQAKSPIHEVGEAQSAQGMPQVPSRDASDEHAEKNPPSTVQAVPTLGDEAGSGDAAGHARAIQIDEPSRPDRRARQRRNSESVAATTTRAGGAGLPRIHTLDQRHLASDVDAFPARVRLSSPVRRQRDLDVGRTRTIDFRDPDDAGNLRLRHNRTHAVDPDFPLRRRMSQSSLHDANPRAFTRTATLEQAAMHSDFGGFPNPLLAAASFAKDKIPGLRNVVDRTASLPRTTTMLSTHSHGRSPSRRRASYGDVKPVSYISFDAIVGRNSEFHGLTTAQQEELGGVEYRALTVLLRIVFAYWLGVQLVAVLAVAPWLATTQPWKSTIRAAGPNPTWFSFFQVWSALDDASMVPFEKAYGLVIVQGLLILAGNTAFPVFLRLLIWTVSKAVPSRSRTRETLQFLLDHPRRCFIYLFPSHQTWFLVFVLVCLNGIDWASFLILDIGNPQIEALATGVRVIDGLFQAIAVRTAGFAIVSLSTVAPALQSVYPIAVSIRSTNVYEEKSMGVYDEDFDEDPDEVEARFNKSHAATKYIGYHARKQLAFDLWWLALAVWLICIVERHRIGSSDWPEVNIFSLIFEIVSAYGTVGLSLGNNRTATSLAGVLSTLSKLIVCAVMLRGRHRGLPIAIDRAVLLPSDLEKHGDDTMTINSNEYAPGDVGRRTRTSFSSHTAVAGGGLPAAEPLTDEDRLERLNRLPNGPQDDMNGDID